MTTVNLIPSPQPYQYDLLGQVTSGKKYWSDGTAVAGQQFEYGFDDIGNRKLARFGGDTNGANLRQSDYKVNLLNQYTNHTVPGYVTLLGEATNTATVKVNSTAADRKSRYYHAELTVTNTTNPLYLSVTNKATNGVLTASVTGNVLLAKTPEVFKYDLDGNLTSDGLWTNTWDGENRCEILRQHGERLVQTKLTHYNKPRPAPAFGVPNLMASRVAPTERRCGPGADRA